MEKLSAPWESTMPLDASELIDFLGEVEPSLEHGIVLVAAGGTAMTLLGAKPSTIDIDFTGPRADVEAFRAATARLPHGFKIDTWYDGVVFTQVLPRDYK